MMTDSNAHFRSVLRGYDTAQVDQHVHELEQAAAAARQEAGERTIEVSKLEAAQNQLRNEIERQADRARALEEAQTKAAAPTYAGLGERIGSILTLADKEAGELRRSAQADAEAHHALSDESARATRQDADNYALETRSSADTEVARILEDAKSHADSLLDDADRQATARREEAEAVYERSRATSAAAAVDFETTLAARRDTSALEFAAEVAAAEQQLAAVQQRSEQTRLDSEHAQQEAASKSAQQVEQATAHAQSLVAEAKTKAERIRGDSERELAAATQRRDSINAQLTNVRQMLATLGGVAMVNPLQVPTAESVDSSPTAVTDHADVAADVQVEGAEVATEGEPGSEEVLVVDEVEATEVAADEVADGQPADAQRSNGNGASAFQKAGSKR